MPEKSGILGMSGLARNTDLGKIFSRKRFWDRFSRIWERIWDHYMCTASTSHKAADSQENKEVVMKKKGYKGRCEKRSLLKCVGICRTYDPIQSAYADRLEADEQVKEFQCNVLLEGLDIGEYTTDFLCTMQDGSLRVRECVSRDHLMKPMNVKLLDASRGYWQKNGVADWKIVTDAEKEA